MPGRKRVRCASPKTDPGAWTGAITIFVAALLTGCATPPPSTPGHPTGKWFWGAWTDLAASYAWRGQKAEAAAAVVELLKVRPDFTVETLEQDGAQYSDNPTFRKQFQSIVEGTRTAGLPER